MYLAGAVTVGGGRLKDFEAQIEIAKRIFLELYPLWAVKDLLVKIITHIYLTLRLPNLFFNFSTSCM